MIARLSVFARVNKPSPAETETGGRWATRRLETWTPGLSPLERIGVRVKLEPHADDATTIDELGRHLCSGLCTAGLDVAPDLRVYAVKITSNVPASLLTSISASPRGLSLPRVLCSWTQRYIFCVA